MSDEIPKTLGEPYTKERMDMWGFEPGDPIEVWVKDGGELLRRREDYRGCDFVHLHVDGLLPGSVNKIPLAEIYIVGVP